MDHRKMEVVDWELSPVGALFAVPIVTVAILAQGTNSGDALCAALFYVPSVRILPAGIRAGIRTDGT